MLYSIPQLLQNLILTLTLILIQAQPRNQDRNPYRFPYCQSHLLLIPGTDATTRNSLTSSSPRLDPILFQRRVRAR